MSAISVDLPESLQKNLRELAERDQVSVSQFIALAVAEKIAALMTLEYLSERGQRASRARFDAALAQVPDVEPEDYDKL